MNQRNELTTMDALSQALSADYTVQGAESSTERSRNLRNSLKRRWWFYLLVTVIAGVVATKVAIDFGRYRYVSKSSVRVQALPFPPGTRYFEPPEITDFSRYLVHPEIAERIWEEYGVPFTPELIDDEYDRKTETITVTVSQNSPEKSASLANQVIAAAIEESDRERSEFLDNSLDYYLRLAAEAEADAAAKRQAKNDRMDALRNRYPNHEDNLLEYQELTDQMSDQRDRLARREQELAEAKQLDKILREDEQKLVQQIKEDLIRFHRQELKTAASAYTATSPQGQRYAEKQQKLDVLAEAEHATADDLTAMTRELSQLLDVEAQISNDYLPRLGAIRDQRYEQRNRQRLLPESIDKLQRSIAQTRDKRAGYKTGEFDFENIPEIQDLTQQIERAERNVDEIMAAIEWVKDMRELETPAYDQLAEATPQAAEPDGNHKKLFVAIFGLVGLVLGVPPLMFDVFRSNVTPSSKLGLEFGLPTLAAQEIGRPSLKKSPLESHDPELRLLANMVQQSAHRARGSVVLFSSVADSLSTDELTRTIASCLVAREEKVLVVDLEDLERHRAGNGTTVALPAMSEEGGDPTTALTNGNKVGLALALAGATKDPNDVLVERGSDGVDRLELGRGELPYEAFASPMMSRLLDHYRNQYSLVLLSGPAAKHLADLEVLSTRCDATLFVGPARGHISTSARRTVMDLMHRNVPVMGIVEVPT